MGGGNRFDLFKSSKEYTDSHERTQRTQKKTNQERKIEEILRLCGFVGSAIGAGLRILQVQELRITSFSWLDSLRALRSFVAN